MLTVKKLLSILLCIILSIITLSLPLTAQAATTNDNATITLNADCCYDEAFDVFTQVNNLRKSLGLSQLKMNQTMLNSAMQRAVEIAVRYDHIRPDGSECFSINSEMKGENIAVLYENANEVMEGWINSSRHYANIISSNYDSMGVGAVIHNGARYWVQVFGKSKTAGITQAPANTNKDFNVYLGSTKYELNFSLSSSMFATDKEDIQILGKNSKFDLYYVINADTFTFTSNNSSVVSVSGNTATALKAGNATITAKNTAATITAKAQVIVFGNSSSSKCGDNITWEYNNRTLTFTGSGRMYDYNTEYEYGEVTSTDIPWADGLKNVESVVVSEGITYLSDSAFACFKNLSDVSLPSTLIEIGDKAFSWCQSLESITIPNNVTTIGSDTFYKCTSLHYVSLPSSLKEIPINMFYSCTGLTGVDIPDDVEKLGLSAFAYCYNISGITLPQSLKYIDGYAFISCTGLKEITIPFNVEYIAKKAFSGCSLLTKVTILNPTTTISSDSVFASTSSNLAIYGYNKSTAQNYCNTNGFNFIVKAGDTPITSAKGYTAVYNGNPITDDISVNIQNAVGDYIIKFSKGNDFDYNACFSTVEELGEYWREDAPYYDRIDGYLINSGTYPISYCVYRDGSQPVFSSASIVIEKAKPQVNYENDVFNAFWYSGGDNTVGFENPLKILGDLEATDIQYTSDNTSILIVDRYGRIYAKKYGECTITATYAGDANHEACSDTITVTTIPVGDIVVGDYSCEFFEDCTVNIKRYYGSDAIVNIPDTILNSKVKNINEKAFYSSACEEIVIPQGIEQIGVNAFTSCYKLISIAIPDTVTTIGDYAFSGCRKLKSVEIPSSVTQIGTQAFGYTAATATAEATKIEDFEISGYSNTAAQTYAEENEFNFTKLDCYEFGDVDGDGDVSILDATAIQLHIAKLIPLDDEKLSRADITNDGLIEILDATALQLKLAGLA